MLKKIRIILAFISILTISLFIVDFYGWLPLELKLLVDIQMIPALLAGNLVLFLSMLVFTIVFGRVYCSVICPLGVFQEFLHWLRKITVKKKNRFKFRVASNFWRYGFLLVWIVALMLGLHFLVGLLDPYSVFGRISLHVFKPVYVAGNNLLAEIRFDGNSFYKSTIYWFGMTSTLIALISIFIVGFMSWKRGRLYCNTVCPVGTFLGLISRFSIFKIYFDDSKCTSCALCASSCKAECIDYKSMTVDTSRCVACFDCLPLCRDSGIKYGIKVPKSKIDQSKRRFLMVGGLAVLGGSKLLAKSTSINLIQSMVDRKMAIMPPGAMNIEHFSSKCTSCHLCVSKCPSQVIKPSLIEYGLNGLMQPMLSFENGFCNYDCTDCTTVCPTDALMPLTTNEKNHLQVGKVQLDLKKCIVVKDETNCGACSEHCPTQAVSMKEWKNSLTIPQINQDICVGCGGCEYICPAEPKKAIYVEGLTIQNKIVIEKKEKTEVIVDDFGF